MIINNSSSWLFMYESAYLPATNTVQGISFHIIGKLSFKKNGKKRGHCLLLANPPPKRVKRGHLLSDYRQKCVNGTRDSYCGVKSLRNGLLTPQYESIWVFWHHNVSQYESQITQKWTFDTTIWVASPIYALLSVIRQQMSPFDPFRGGVAKLSLIHIWRCRRRLRCRSRWSPYH